MRNSVLIPKNCQGYWTTEGYFFDDADPPPVVASITLEASFFEVAADKDACDRTGSSRQVFCAPGVPALPC